MNICRFCGRQLKNAAAFAAHARYCVQYKNSRTDAVGNTSTTRPKQNSSLSTDHATGSDSYSSHASTMTMTEAIQQFNKDVKKQQRETIIRNVRTHVVDHYSANGHLITPSMRVGATILITEEFRKLPLEQMPYDELLFRAEALRNRCWAADLVTNQKRQSEEEAQKAQRDTEMIKQVQLERKKRRRRACLIERGVLRASERALELDLPSSALELLNVEVRARLEATVIGDETSEEVEEILVAMVDPPLLDWTLRVKALRRATESKRQTHLIELMTPIVKETLPVMQAWLVKGLQAWHGIHTSAEAKENTGASAQTSDAQHHASRPSLDQEPSTPPPVFDVDRENKNSVITSADVPSRKSAA